MKKQKHIALLLIAIATLAFSCTSNKLQPGGAYAPTNTVVAVAPDIGFYTVESSFLLAESVVQTAFKFERDNRDMLWKISPDIKHTLDKIRPVSVEAIQRYAAARAVYKANPIPANLSTMQELLQKMQQLAASAQAAIKINTNNQPK